MRVRNLKTTVLGVLCAGAVAVGGGREYYDHFWDHPCPPLDCDPWIEPPVCWCEADWDDEDNWGGIDYPHESDDLALIEHSNTGYCHWGINHGNPCSEHDDCLLGQCENIESFVKVNLSTETIWYLTLRTKSTTASDDKLSIKFTDTGTLTLNGTLKLDAEDGPITVSVTDTATLKTDYTP